MASYLRPRLLSEAVAALDEAPRVIVAGGTDFYPMRVGRAPDEDVLDITAVDGLRGVVRDGDHHRIGALTTWTDLLEADLPAWFDGLKLAAREVGGVQIQNTGTVAGNLCNASPAADGTPNLVALDAEVELTSAAGARRLPVGEFVTGNRSTRLRPGEICTAVLVPVPGPGTVSTFVKLGSRAYLVISIVMVAATLTPGSGGRVGSARIAVGACSAVPRRLPDLEAALAGRPLDGALSSAAAPSHLEHLAPIDDVRGTAGYRREAALVLVRRSLDRLAAEAAR